MSEQTLPWGGGDSSCPGSVSTRGYPSQVTLDWTGGYPLPRHGLWVLPPSPLNLDSGTSYPSPARYLDLGYPLFGIGVRMSGMPPAFLQEDFLVISCVQIILRLLKREMMEIGKGFFLDLSSRHRYIYMVKNLLTEHRPEKT